MRILILPALLVIASFARAQDIPSAEESPGASGRVAWFVSTELPEGLENPVKVLSGKNLTEVTLSKRSPSEPVKITGDGMLRIVREKPNPEKPGEVTYAVLGEAQVPKGANKVLVILIPLAKPDGDLLFGAKVQNLAGFKGGDWLYLNLTNADIGVQLGENRTVVKPAGLAIQSTSELDKAMNMTVTYNYRLPEDNEWKMITSSTVVVMPTRREICIFSADPEFGRISYHGITFPVE